MKAQDITINPNILLWRSSNTWCNSGEKAGYGKTKSSSSNVIMWKGGYMTVCRTTASANNRRDNEHVTRTCVVVKEVSKQTAWDRLITDNKDVLLTLEFHHDRLQSTHDIHVRLADRTQHNTSNPRLLPAATTYCYCCCCWHKFHISSSLISHAAPAFLHQSHHYHQMADTGIHSACRKAQDRMVWQCIIDMATLPSWGTPLKRLMHNVICNVPFMISGDRSSTFVLCF